jgi:PIN domain nuclease of toxin-antitoxin system
VLLWGVAEPWRVPQHVAAALASPRNTTLVSVVCLWEAAIKSGLGKLNAPANLPEIVQRHGDFRLLPIEVAHVWQVRDLPPIHRDPFDRLLIAQAMVEDMTIVTRDAWMSRYGVPTIAV